MTGERNIDYDALTQDAMRGIVRTVLLRVATMGLPGEHHFYIAFDPRVPGVVVSDRLKAKYPEEMTIVLQHQFWQLVVNEERFEVTLSFDNVPERLTVPFRAVRVFFDPSVPYVLQFEGSDLLGEAVADVEPAGSETVEAGRRLGAPSRPATDDAAEPVAPLEKARNHRKPRAAKTDAAREAGPRSLVEAGAAGAPVQRRQAARPKVVRSKPDQPANDANVIELDKFRKK
jgi:hypothetical protein